jgi:hypothetical protein
MTLLMQVPAPVVQLEITEALSSAISAAAGLCVEDQNYLGWRIMEEIAEDQKWADSFAGSLGVLDKLAAEALAEHDRGETRPLEEIL